MKKIKIILQHGWGVDKTFLINLADYIKNNSNFETIILDAGYFGEPYDIEPETGVRYIGVGQAMGFMKLVEREEFNWLGIAAISGYTKYIPNKNTLTMVEGAIIAFKDDPKFFLQLFYDRLHIKTPNLENLNFDLLLSDLYKMTEGDITDTILKHENIINIHARKCVFPTAPYSQAQIQFKNYKKYTIENTTGVLGDQKYQEIGDIIIEFSKKIINE